MVIKCKICGGDVQFQPGDTSGQCEYCGSASTIPRTDDEQRLNRFNRANHFRRQGEFDKAIAACERILEEDDTDAEAHWYAALSRYGIEYVEDPATGKRIPTCHRVRLESILADADYQAALQYAPDTLSRNLYEEQAKEIAEIQKGILAISASEKPYDVFICYKETDENGKRTRDSALAQEVYYGLTEQGYKVFFSRITLEDKLGQEYEPYIFAALNSARVMVVIGTKPEYISAVWVKNEWSRYLHLMKDDRKRLLIPCYRDMDPYDLPEELSNLQSQDMSKIGFMQDLLRGVKKVLDADKKTEQAGTARQETRAGASAPLAPGIQSLMERTYLFMEDGDFDNASEYLNRVLDLDPKYAPAYAAKTCTAFGLRREADLAGTTFRYEDNPDWQKAIRFATPEQKKTYEGYAEKVKERTDVQIRNYAYDCAVEMAVRNGSDRGKLDAELAAYKASCTRSAGNRADGSRRPDGARNEAEFRQSAGSGEPGDVTEQELKTAASMFDAVGDEEAAARARECRTLAEQARQKAIYRSAAEMSRMRKDDPAGLEQAANIFLSVPGYRDSKQQAQQCADKAEAIRSALYRDAVEAMRAAGEKSQLWEKAKRELARTELNGYRNTKELREKAQKLFDECTAAEKEAIRQAEERTRREAEAAAAKKKRLKIIAAAAVIVIIVAVFLTIKVIIPGSRYSAAKAMQKEGKYEEAIAAFEALNGYGDSAEQILETKYLQAASLNREGKYAEAYAIYATITGYKDVDSIIANDENIVREAKYAVGNYVTFGVYPQTKAGNDSTPIEWLVLARNGQKALLLSRYGLDAKPYNTEYKDVTWETCTLRSWLNGDFMNKAFTAGEQAGIMETEVDNSGSQGYSGWKTNGGNKTRDMIFLLSYAEANKYLGVTYDDSNNIKSRVSPTAYTSQQGAYTSESNKTADGEAAGWWWLRSPGSYQNYAALVNSDGSLSYFLVTFSSGCIRPALWINLESGIF